MIGKNNIAKMSKNYTKIPIKIYDMNLHAYSLSIYALMCDCGEDFNPSIGFISKKLKISKNTVIKYLDVLVRRQIISIVQEGNLHNVSVYKFNPPNQWNKFVDIIETKK